MRKKRVVKHYNIRSQKKSFMKSFKRFRLHHRIIFYFLGSFGVILMWKGFGALIDHTPLLSHPLTSLGVGVGLTLVGGALLEA